MDDSPFNAVEVLLLLVWASSAAQLSAAAAQLLYFWRRGVLAGGGRRWAAAALVATYVGTLPLTVALWLLVHDWLPAGDIMTAGPAPPVFAPAVLANVLLAPYFAVWADRRARGVARPSVRAGVRRAAGSVGSALRTLGVPGMLVVAGVAVGLFWGTLMLPVLGLGGFGPGAPAPVLAFGLVPPALASLLMLAGGVWGLLRVRRSEIAAARPPVAAAPYALAALGGLAGTAYTLAWLRAVT